MMITNSWFWIIFVAGLGLPSVIVNFAMKRIEKKIEVAETEKAEKEKTRIDYETMMIELSMASLSLAEATASAVQNIPEAHANGTIKSALGWSREIKNKYYQFAREQTAKAVNG